MTDWPKEKERIADLMRPCKTLQQLRDVWVAEADAIAAVRSFDPALGIQLVNLKDWLKPQMIDDPARQGP